MALNQYLAERKEALSQTNRPAMIMTHVVCGYPSFEDNWKELEIMQEFGVDLVELQFPFSEPSADGPLFVKANQEAISNGVHVEDCFAFMEKVTNHLGFILPDLPINEAAELHELAKELDLSAVVLMTPTNTDERLAELAACADGFIYTVARKGVTGSNTNMNDEVSSFIDRCRKFTDVPLAVGFGVSEAKDVEFIGQHADIAVIGTAALKAWEHGKEESLRAFFKQV